jgi:LPS-assembly protein
MWLRGAGAVLLLVGLAVAPASAQTPSPSPVRLPVAGGEVVVTADRIEQIAVDNLTIATGNVEVVRGAARLTADRVEINRETGAAVAEGRVVFYDGVNELVGRRLEYNLRTGTGIVYDADARSEPYYRLHGARMDRVGQGVYQVERGTFTTCQDDPPAWSFRFGSADATFGEFIHGRDASFWVKGLPLIPFLPFFAAPVGRDRQSGFLFPRGGSSGFKGVYAEVPFYWAISDSQDATVALDVFSKRGIGATAEYRYILSEHQQGSARGFYVNEFWAEGQQRALGTLRHFWDISPGLSVKADVSGVTDDTLLRNYGDRLHQRSAQRIESNVFLTRTWPTWNFVADAFFYQDLTTERPVELQRLPELSLVGPPQPLPGPTGVLYQLDTSFDNFVRTVGSAGQRLDLHPQLSRPFSPGGNVTVTPFVGGRLTAYDKTVVGTRTARDGIVVEVTKDEPRVRRLLEAGTDVELTASRVYALHGWGGFDALLHSIEPRVGYLWIGGEDQDQLPQWTALDRIPNSSLVTYSLINRVRVKTVAPPATEPTRIEMVRLSVGNAYDLLRERLELVTGELILRPTTQVAFRGTVAYDVNTPGFDSATTDLFVAFPRVVGSIGTRYSDPGSINFIQGRVTAEITRNLVARLSTDWDIRAGAFVENRFGLDFRFQCWAFTVEYVTRSRSDNEVRFALNLLGVGGPITTSMGVGSLESSNQR